MKKSVAYIFALLLVILPLGACGGQNEAGKTEKIKIVSAIFPSYDWVREILGERSTAVDLELLIDNGVDMHSYQPSAQDMITISDCDMFIYVGGESDAWVQDALGANENPDRIVIDLMQILKDAERAGRACMAVAGKCEGFVRIYCRPACAAGCRRCRDIYVKFADIYRKIGRTG